MLFHLTCLLSGSLLYTFKKLHSGSYFFCQTTLSYFFYSVLGNNNYIGILFLFVYIIFLSVFSTRDLGQLLYNMHLLYFIVTSLYNTRIRDRHIIDSCICILAN